MTQKSTKRLLSSSLTIIVALLIVLSMVTGGVSFAGTAAATTSETTPSMTQAESLETTTVQTTDNDTNYSDDFEDGNADGWVSDGTFNVVEEGYYGDYAITQNDTDQSDAGDQVVWDNGPSFDTTENFEVSGTYKASGDDWPVRIGLIDPNDLESQEGAMIVQKFNNDEIYLATVGDEEAEDKITNAPSNQWLNFRLQIQDGDARAKVWEAGTEEPSNWQLSRSFEAFQGKFFIGPGYDNKNREITLGRVDAGTNAITGQVVDQNGDPVSNATVEAMGVDYDSLNDTIEDKEDRARDLLEEAENPVV